MQGRFSSSQTVSTDRNNTLGAPGGPNWNNVSFFQTDVPAAPPPAPAAAGAPPPPPPPIVYPRTVSQTIVRTKQPVLFFELGQHVFLIVSDKNDAPENADNFIPPGIPRTKENRAAFWKVPFNYVRKIVQNVAGGAHITEECTLPVTDSRELDDEFDHSEIMSDDQVQCVLSIYLPDPKYVSKTRHMWFPTENQTFWTIGSLWIMDRIKQAQSADFEFAQRIQGLQGSTQEAVWANLDANNMDHHMDRNAFVHHFLSVYIHRFLLAHPPGERTNNPDRVVAEAVRMYEEMSSQWESGHIKQLSAKVQGCGEGLLSIFYEHISPRITSKLTVKQLYSLIRRDTEMSPLFTMCLHYYITKIDQDKGTRNANYKSMNNVNAANVYAMQALNKFFIDFSKKIQNIIEDGNKDSVKGLELYWMTMDWPMIAEQLRFRKQPFQGWRHQLAPAAMPGVAGGGGGGPVPAPAFLR